MFPGNTKTIAERIADNKRPYYKALEQADEAWANGEVVDVSAMEKLLQGYLEAQLEDVRVQAMSGHREDGD